MSVEETNNKLPEAAEYYAGTKGWYILPCHGIVGGRCTCAQSHAEPKMVGKHPVINQWNLQSTNDPERVKKWWDENSYYNIGVHCSKSGFFVIDIDPRSGGPDSFIEFEKLVEGNLPPTVEAITGTYTGIGGTASRGRHIFYKCDPNEGLIGNLNNLDLKGVDIKHNGYVLISPSQHFSGVTYEWAPGHAPWEIEMAEAPEALLEVLRKRTKRSSYSLSEGSWDDLEWERVDIAKIMRDGIDEGSRAVDVYKLTCALANKFGTDETSRRVIESDMIRFNQLNIRPPMDIEGPNGLLMHVHRAIDFVADNPKLAFTAPEVAAWMKKQGENMSKQPQALLGVVQPPSEEKEETPSKEGTWWVGDAVKASVESGASISQASRLSKINVPLDQDSLDEEDGGVLGARSMSDTGNGRRLVDVFGSALRYTSGLGWFTWDNGYWKPDVEDLGVSEEAKKIAPIISAEVARYPESQASEVIKWASQSRSNSRIRGAIESAKSDPRISIPLDEWDKDDNLLGVLNGVIDLRTGDLLQGRPDLLITKRAPVSYTRGHTNTRWENFLDQATQGDKELQEWLQRAAGYTLSGHNMHDLMFLVYGPPGSGKNTFVEALVKCLGTRQYAWPLDSVVLAQGDGMSSSSDQYHWAELRGRRMVWVDELPESERLKENAVKRLTGSSEISARSPGEKPFTFQSHAKLWVSTNNRPIITDDAMWRRIRPIPFEYKPTEPDPGLKDYIFDPEGALPAVLSWAVEGAIKVMNSKSKDAIGWCSAVSKAADIYRKNEDRLGMFLDEETETAKHEDIPLKTLFYVYREWANDRGEKPMTQIAFTRKISERGLDVDGSGNRAKIKDIKRRPRDVSGTNYGDLYAKAQAFNDF